MNMKLVNYIENSFLSPLLKDELITDISFNGVSLFYLHSQKGRLKFDYNLSLQEANDFIRQIANFSEKQFSYSEPILDVSIGRYRINAVHNSIVRINDEKAVSFSMRMASKNNKIPSDKQFMDSEMKEYLISLLENNESIVIAGETGSGKTELQKYLISLIKKNSRIIVIDNIQELEALREDDLLDLTSWQVYPNMPDRTFESLIRNALRSNPDWLIVAEARGKEMADVLLSVTTGHPIITTMHANDVLEISTRMARMIQLNSPNEQFSDILNDVKNNFVNYVYLKRDISSNGEVKRYISSIARIDKNSKELKIIKERKHL